MLRSALLVAFAGLRAWLAVPLRVVKLAAVLLVLVGGSWLVFRAGVRAASGGGIVGRVVTRAIGGKPADGTAPSRGPDLPRSGVVPPSRRVGELTHPEPAPVCLPVEVLVPGPERIVQVPAAAASGPVAEPAGWSPEIPSLAPQEPGKARLGLVGRVRAWAARKSAERAAGRVEGLFPGQLDLDSEYLLAAGDLLASATGYRLGAKIPKTGGRARLIYDRLDRPFLAVGGLRRLSLAAFYAEPFGAGLPAGADARLRFEADGLRVYGRARLFAAIEGRKSIGAVDRGDEIALGAGFAWQWGPP